VPRYVEITDALLPRTPTEKVARGALKQRGVTDQTFDRGAR
jgi:crotonobetaine/carnitine-CoA ligase